MYTTGFSDIYRGFFQYSTVAYCPKCNKIVADRWIECPVCRTEVVHKDTPRRDTGVILNKPPGKEDKKQFDFLGRVIGVLTFKAEAFDNISTIQPVGEAIILLIVNLLISMVVIYPKTYIRFATNLPPSVPASSLSYLTIGFVGGIIGGVIFLIIGVAITHLILRVLGGRGDFMTTFNIMLFIGLVWGIAGNLLGGAFIWSGFPLIILYAFSIIFSLIAAVEYLIAFPIAHDISKAKSIVAVVLSYIVQFVLGFLAGVVLGVVVVMLLALKA